MQEAPRELTTNRLNLRPPAGGDRALWVRLHRDPASYEHGIFEMPESDDDAAKVERGESVFSPVPVCIMIGGGFATLLMAKSAFDLLIRYGGL